jgi:hypothetical protein
MRITAVLLVVLSLASPLAAGDNACERSIDRYGSEVESQMRLPYGSSISWVDKHLSRLGDASSVVLIRTGIVEKQLSAGELKQVLYILQTSFECRFCIEEKENKGPRVTFALLQLLRFKYTDPSLQTLIDETKKAIEDQVNSKQSR